ncbi:hypothetical protein [Bradyrhizobium sp. USDA 4506]
MSQPLAGSRCRIVSIAQQIEWLNRERVRLESIESDEASFLGLDKAAGTLFDVREELKLVTSHMQAESLVGALHQITIAYNYVDELRSFKFSEEMQDDLADRLERLLYSAVAEIKRHVAPDQARLAQDSIREAPASLVLQARVESSPPGEVKSRAKRRQ